MAKSKKKSWKESFCDECDLCVNRRCRKDRPEHGRYPVVVGIGSNKTKTEACSSFE